jgi:predicted DNA-binding protein
MKKTPLHVQLPVELLARLDALSKKTSYSKTVLVRQAIEALLEKYDAVEAKKERQKRIDTRSNENRPQKRASVTTCNS